MPNGYSCVHLCYRARAFGDALDLRTEAPRVAPSCLPHAYLLLDVVIHGLAVHERMRCGAGPTILRMLSMSSISAACAKRAHEDGVLDGARADSCLGLASAAEHDLERLHAPADGPVLEHDGVSAHGPRVRAP